MTIRRMCLLFFLSDSREQPKSLYHQTQLKQEKKTKKTKQQKNPEQNKTQ